MKITRKSVFETNSSSAHSVCIVKGTDYVCPPYQEVIEIAGGRYGWGYSTESSFEDKLNYVGQMIWCIGNNETKDLLKEVLIEMTNCKQVIWDNSSLEEGYVDHQSLDNSFLNKEDLKNLLFLEQSHIVITNDNC